MGAPEVQLHSFLTSTLYGGQRLLDVGGRAPGTHCVEEKTVVPARNRTTIPPSSSPYTDYITQVKYHNYIIAKFPVITIKLHL